jgi:dipeptidyl-peptidase-3
MKTKHLLYVPFAALSILMSSCGNDSAKPAETVKQDTVVSDVIKGEDGQLYQSEQFADLRVLHYYIPQWDSLSLKQKELVYYLTQAGLAGRDIIYDQSFKYNLAIRNAFEKIYTTYSGDKTSSNWKNIEIYLKQIWSHNGIHHAQNNNKLTPAFERSYFEEVAKASSVSLNEEILNAIFDPGIYKMRTESDTLVDIVAQSATNMYEGVTLAEAEAFYEAKKKKGDRAPVSYGINSKLVKVDGKVTEMVYRVGGLYSAAIEQIVFWLEKAEKVAENDRQAASLRKLIEFYKTGDLRTWDDFNILWAGTLDGDIDFIQGFVETYHDPIGLRGSYESIVEIKDFEASQRMKVMMNNAQWFEDNSSTDPLHKKDSVVGVVYNVVNVAGESGDASPQTPIGVNLPNSNWIRAKFGSKSVSLGNIEHAYENASGPGFLEEFAHDKEEVERSKKHSDVAGKLHTALHEVVGHASGKILEDVEQPRTTLKNYASTIEEGRADLVALYFMMDPKMIELGLMESLEVGKAEYDSYIRNGLLVQLRRLEEGKKLEEAHMRNRAWISRWVLEKGKADNVIAEVKRDGKTYYDIQDYDKLRALFGQLLKEVQRITSEGDFAAAAALADGYGRDIDPALHKEVIERAKKFNMAPFSSFVNPELEAVLNDAGEVTDVKVNYPTSFAEQMLRYSKNYGFLAKELE